MRALLRDADRQAHVAAQVHFRAGQALLWLGTCSRSARAEVLAVRKGL